MINLDFNIGDSVGEIYKRSDDKEVFVLNDVTRPKAEKEYIERKDLINNRPPQRNPDQTGKEEYNKGYNDGIKAVLSCIEIKPSIPSIFSPLSYRFEFFVTSADVAPVRHAKWVLIDECVNEGVYCSNCHKKIYRAEYANQKVKSNFCPNCGAKMDEE